LLWLCVDGCRWGLVWLSRIRPLPHLQHPLANAAGVAIGRTSESSSLWPLRRMPNSLACDDLVCSQVDILRSFVLRPGKLDALMTHLGPLQRVGAKFVLPANSLYTTARERFWPRLVTSTSWPRMRARVGRRWQGASTIWSRLERLLWAVRGMGAWSY